MEQGDREIEVRTLTGESTTISVSPNMTIEDLKVLLKQNFLPAATSPKFHLFLKGVKLSLERRISDAIAPEDFILLVHFAKKSRLQTQQAHHSDMLSEASSHSPASKFANLAWSDMMNDLSLLGNALTNGSQTHYDSEIMNFDRSNGIKVGDPVKHSLEKISKTKVHDAKPEELPDDLVSTILRSPCENFVNQNCEALIKVLELVTCLSDPQSGECFLLREACHVDTCLCLCPPWLKTLVKAFAFLNIFSAYCQLHHEEVTLNRLNEALNLLGKSGPQIGILDMKNLSCLCPKAIHFGCQTECTNSSYSIVVVDASSAQINQVESTTKKALKRLSLSKIVNVMKKRERSFRKTLWESIKLLTWKNGHKVDIFFSLDDLLELVKERNTIASGNGAKRTKRKWSTPSTSQLVQTRCCDLNHLLPEEMVRHLRVGIGSSGQMVHVEDIGAREANYVDLPDDLSETTKSALQRIGISRLYSHQAQSIRASLAGKNVVVATMTSSGKSLCYNLPVLEALSKNLQSCALYLFPTKALSQDQLRALLAMIEGYDACLNIGVYDGDTSPEERTWLCDNARLLITNPDMLHVSILPFHSQFRRILSNLRFLVIDEAHIYKGAFGCHSALILRRLRRLCSHVYGSDPSFVFCTATSANPREHAMELANLKKLELIQNDGSPSGRKFFILWNPPLCMKTVPDTAKSSKKMNKFMDRKVVSRRSSSIMEISLLFAEMIQHGLRSIAFCKTRKLCELVLCYTREILQEVAPELVNSICSYRGGYMAEDRRRIERDFFNGKLSGIAATNALELGIDVGHIDVTLHLGFPGSIASLWQQAGRSGRRERPSLSIYVAFEGPLDQYFMNYPQKLFRSSIECCHIDAQNHQVLEQHLACAAFEHPLSLLFDEKHFGTGLSNAVISLKDKGLLSVDLSRDASVRIWSYIGHEKMPSREVGIRAIEAEKYLVIDKERNEIIEEVEESKAFFQVYEGAVYMNQGKTYLVKELDISRKIAFCHKSDLKYYTKTRDYTDIHVIGGEIAYPAQVSANKFKKGAARMNTCKVTTAWFGFYRIWRGSNRVFDTVELSLPTYSYESQAVWIRVPQSIKSAVESENLLFRPGLHAASHALLNVVPLHVICNLSDLAPECANPHDKRFVPERILLYDQHPGGTGIVAQVLPRFGDLLIAAYELLKSCRCQGDTGCPNCIQSIACHEYNEVLHKDAAIMIIKGVLDADAETLNSG